MQAETCHTESTMIGSLDIFDQLLALLGNNVDTSSHLASFFPTYVINSQKMFVQ